MTIITSDTSLARSLHARLYFSSDGRLFSFGDAAPRQLWKALSRFAQVPVGAEAPPPGEFGCVCNGELTDRLLDAIRVALDRWEHRIEAETCATTNRRRVPLGLTRESVEVRRLRLRWTEVCRRRAAAVFGEIPAESAYFLDSVAEAQLAENLAAAGRAGPLAPLVAWHARVTAWLAGNCAVGRYLNAAAEIDRAYPVDSRWEPIQVLQKVSAAWTRRTSEEPLRDLRSEIARHLRSVPAGLLREAQIPLRFRGRDLAAQCDSIRNACHAALESRHRHRYRVGPGGLAALAATDGSAMPLPCRFLAEAARSETPSRLKREIEMLADHVGKPGYDALLATIDRLPEIPGDYQLRRLGELLAKGTSTADALWVWEKDLLRAVLASCLTVGQVRQLEANLKRSGLSTDWPQMDMLVRSIGKPDDLKAAEAFPKWLRSVTPQSLTPRLRAVVEAAFHRRYLPVVRRRGWFDEVAACFARVPPGDSPAHLHRLLDAIVAYRATTGGPATLPKSLRKLREWNDRRRCELEHLRASAACGGLDPSAQARLKRLQNAAPRTGDSSRLRRSAEELFLRCGIEAFETVVRNLEAARCRRYVGDLVDLLPAERLGEFAHWIEKMSEEERRRLSEVMEARRLYGRSYKRYLTENQPWIARASEAGVDTEHWLDAEPERLTIDGREMEIGVSAELDDIFQMGSYFGTCLSLGDTNEMSVLTNATDADKQVVFMHAVDGAGRRQVISRQLIAVSADFKLLGYFCYAYLPRVQKSARAKITAAMARYIGRLAARCKLELLDAGSPQTIGDHFWYDDESRTWPPEARDAWSSVPSRYPGSVMLQGSSAFVS